MFLSVQCCVTVSVGGGPVLMWRRGPRRARAAALAGRCAGLAHAGAAAAKACRRRHHT